MADTYNSGKSANNKGKATPKRSAAQSKLKVNAITAPKTKADKSSDKAALRAARANARAAFMRGDESALPARDKGPVRRYVRNYVDSQRTIGEYFLPTIMLVLVLTVIPNRSVQLFAILFMYSVMFYAVISGLFFTRKIRKLVKDKFPDSSTKGLGMYGWLRSTQMRRLRAPAPQVSRGEKI
jgi:Protein of unknown function (DUF3043)